MLLPRYSLRATLLAISSCAVFFLILGQAVQGRPWAIVIAAAIVSLIATLLIHALLFLLSAALTKLVGSEQLPARTSRGGIQSTPDEQSPPKTNESAAANP